MHKILICLLLLLGSPAILAGDMIPDPETWYSQGYGPLWSYKPIEHVGEILTYYADQVETHSNDGSISKLSKEEWLTTPLSEWEKEGWTHSDLAVLKTDRINDTTVIFKSSWTDHYRNAADETSCGWYVADFLDGRWQFTAYAEIDCAAHGL